MRSWSLACCLLLTVFAGCGYTTGSLLPSNFRTIYIEPFQNKVGFVNENVRALYVPLLESKVRQSVVDRFVFDGHLRVKDGDKSDLVLKGNLIGFQRDELRLTDNQEVEEYRLRIIISMTLTDTSNGTVVWTEPSFAGEATYFTSGPQAKSESAAMSDALLDLSRRVVERTLENW